MKFAPSLSSSRAVPILSRVFPLRLRCIGLGYRRSLQTERAFSTRAFRGSRSGLGSDLLRGYDRRDPPRGRDDESEGHRSRIREKGDDREPYPMKRRRRRRDSDSGDFGDSRNREFRSPGMSKRFHNKSEVDKEDRSFPPRNKRGGSNSNLVIRVGKDF